MQKSALQDLARSIKHLDISLWKVDRESKEGKTITKSRQGLIKIIFAEGYEITTQYRLIKSRTPRSITD